MRFSTIFTVRSLKSLFESLRSFILISLKSGPLRALFCQFAQSALLFVSRSAIALKIKVRSRAKSERAISKSDVPSSGKMSARAIAILGKKKSGERRANLKKRASAQLWQKIS